MGQPIVVIETPSATHPGMVRFQTNRALTGTGHERYVVAEEVRGDRPPDELARRLLARGGIEAIHMNGSVVTVDLAKGFDSSGLREIIENLYIHYPETLAADGNGDGDSAPAEGSAPETEGELVEQESAAAPAAPEPDRPAPEQAPAAAEELAAEVAAGEAAPPAPAPAESSAETS